MSTDNKEFLEMIKSIGDAINGIFISDRVSSVEVFYEDVAGVVKPRVKITFKDE